VRGGVPTRALVTAGAVLLSAVPVAGAASAATQKASHEVFQDYSADGRIDACEHSSKTLALALENIPPDVEQYASDYPSAIEDAIEARARGDCSDKPASAGGTASQDGGTTATGTPGTAATPAPSAGAPGAAAGDPAATQAVVSEPPGPDAAAAAVAATAGRDAALDRVAGAGASSEAPLPVLLLGLLAAGAALTALLLPVLRRLGLADDRVAPVGHAFAEARWHARGTWDDFRDWLRAGR
jgi:outer membrane murein-binding lipoprotein Lpp